MPRQRKRVPVNQSALFKIPSPCMLGKVLLEEPTLLRALASSDNYLRFEKDGRRIEAPKPNLKRIQRRFAALLGQLETPPYLHSAIKGCSYISNADGHLARYGTLKLDVQKFFPSARARDVYLFFKDVMRYPPDIADFTTRLLTVDDHLPTGGNASPILSFWAYRPMFDAVDALARDRGCHFTLYVDDMTISGEVASRLLLRHARTLVGNFGLRAHKAHVFHPRQARVVTGVAMTIEGRRLPHRREHAIGLALQHLAAAKNDEDRLVVLGPLIGRVCEAAQVDPAWSSRAHALVMERRATHRRLQLSR